MKSANARSILEANALSELRRIAENVGPLIVEHRHYRGARAPTRLIFEDAGELEAYVRTEGRPGDSFWIWSYGDCCADTNAAVRGKVPDANGQVPEGGAY